MQELLYRHVGTAEATLLGVELGWYGTKVSGTFVTGPHTTDAECIRKIAELTGPIKKAK